ncbi:hypothetical protein ACH5RR_035899 [Cinchona calisaya]|uniref:GCK domain-containing protein n=1 Tax=Cinchona calisaya TaxID=153742 RepID=A0ABD2Y5J2_9GENT
MPSSDSPQTHESNPQSEPTHDPKTPETEAKAAESSDPPSEKTPEDSEVKQDDAVPEGEGEDEEVGECGFCLFMKAGGCKEEFMEWEKCVQEGDENQEDIVEKCFEVTGKLRKCMEVHADYYKPLLDAEKAAQEEARKELEKEKERENAVEESGLNKDAVLSVSEQKNEEKDGVLPVSEQKNEEGS